jgi:hypothetical protein
MPREGRRAGRCVRWALMSCLSAVVLLVVAPAAFAENCSRGFTNGVSEPSVIEGIYGGDSWSIGGARSILIGEGFTFASEVKVGDQAASSFTVLSDEELELVAPPEDQYATEHGGGVEVVVTTPGGSSYSCPLGENFVDYKPTVQPTAFTSRHRGPQAGGTEVLINGVGYTQNEISPAVTGVDFGSTPATSFQVLGAHEIRAIAPPGTGTVHVTVTTEAGTSAETSEDSYEYEPLPEIAFVEPDEGPNAGGNTVTLWTKHAEGVTDVRFGNTQATSFKEHGIGKIEAVVPPGTGFVNVRITSEAGTSAISESDQYVYREVPVVTGVEPSVAKARSKLRIVGHGFSGATTVEFGSTAEEPFEVHPDEIVVYAPFYEGGRGTVDVRVVNAGGTSAVTSADHFTVEAERLSTTPTVEPKQGPVAGGQTVTLTGQQFVAVTEVDFGSEPASSFEQISEKEIRAVAPPGHGTVDVTLVNTSGRSPTAASDRYSYVTTPIITGLSPSSSAANLGETEVRVHGENFEEPLSFEAGGVAVSRSKVDSPQEATVWLPNSNIEGETFEVHARDAGGTSAATPADVFTFLPLPQLTSISQAWAPEAGAPRVTIKGKHLAHSSVVEFGSTPGQVLRSDEEEAVVSVPPGTGDRPVWVSTDVGRSWNGLTFNYVGSDTVPHFGRCLSVSGTGGYSTKKCSMVSQAHTGKGELIEGLAKPGFSVSGASLTLTQASNKQQVLSCSGASGTGEFEGAGKLGGMTIALTGCTSAGHACQSGATAGEIRTQPMEGLPVPVTGKSAGILLQSVSSDDVVAAYSCGGADQTLSGGVMAGSKQGKPGTALALSLKATSKAQKPDGSLLGGPSSTLAVNGSHVLVNAPLQLRAQETFVLAP